MIIKKDITTIEKGVIMHQVNCQDVMGAGYHLYLKNIFERNINLCQN